MFLVYVYDEVEYFCWMLDGVPRRTIEFVVKPGAVAESDELCLEMDRACPEGGLAVLDSAPSPDVVVVDDGESEVTWEERTVANDVGEGPGGEVEGVVTVVVGGVEVGDDVKTGVAIVDADVEFKLADALFGVSGEKRKGDSFVIMVNIRHYICLRMCMGVYVYVCV